jgi:hypothetical protein
MTAWTAAAHSSIDGAHMNLSMRPSRRSGAYNVLRSLPVIMIGTRRNSLSSLHSSAPTLTLVGWSHRFINVPITICMFTVFCVALYVPAPASRSLMTRHASRPV